MLEHEVWRLPNLAIPSSGTSSLPGIGQEKQADEGAGGKQDAPGIDQTPAAPTVVVEGDTKATPAGEP